MCWSWKYITGHHYHIKLEDSCREQHKRRVENHSRSQAGDQSIYRQGSLSHKPCHRQPLSTGQRRIRTY
ncbi:hypothetical protein B0O80DRAFT_432666 [Mortierella sp. GBAus27b]|nr:hypothetical protein B0O80DRAFT_432666 [Mortierella sp. GBAus27b]